MQNGNNKIFFELPLTLSHLHVLYFVVIDC